jgi:hypothetical protein
MIKTCCIGIILSLPAVGGLQIQPGESAPCLAVDGTECLALDTPWVADGKWDGLYRFPADLAAPIASKGDAVATVRESKGQHGTVVQKLTVGVDSVTVRYEFDFAEIKDAAHVQWVLRLEPDRFDGAMVRAEGTKPVALRPLAKAHIPALKSARLLLSSLDLDIEVSAADGEWKLGDQRQSPWAKCYRLEYNRDFALQGSRKGWFELKLTAKTASGGFLPLTKGEKATAKGIPFQFGTPVADLDAKLGAIALWHTAGDGTASRNEAVGEMQIHYQDREAATMPLRWEQAVTSPTDDLRDLSDGLLVATPDGTPAWITTWRNPFPDSAVNGVSFRTLGADWHAIAATGIVATGDDERLGVALAMLRPTGSVPEESVVSLDGTWRFDPEGDTEPFDIAVPMRWELAKGCRNVHTATYSRDFDLPLSFSDRRILLHFDAVGEFCEVRVNGRSAGCRLVGPAPAEFDITGLVTVPSTANRLEVIVQDDTHFSVPRPSSDWRNLRHFVPHGIGGNCRKGLFQSVTLRARPTIHIADARIQTSVREKRLAVHYELRNPGRTSVQTTIGGTVRPAEGGDACLVLPETPVELPGQMTTNVTLTAEWANPVLWQPNHPQLYELRSILADAAGKRLQRHDARFGFREVWFSGIHFYLNGIRCNLRGESPSYNQNNGPLETRAGAEAVVRRALAANFNVLRFHAVPAPPHVYDVCDELGMLVIDESAIYASWGMVLPEHPDYLDNCRDHLRRWVRRDRNHPAVVLWSADNEGLNVSQFSPALLAEFSRTVDENDGTRPVIFDGDGSSYGTSPASVKHYVRTIDDLKELGGKASGYGHDLRNDIYWAAEYKQPLPLGIGEFLYPANDAMTAKRAEVYACMGLQTRGYRYANWFDIRPYNPHYTGAVMADEPKEEYRRAWDTIVKSFAAIAVFDKEYDALGPLPEPPEIPVGQATTRTLIVYNDAFEDDHVTVEWLAELDGKRIAGGETTIQIALGEHTEFETSITPPQAGQMTLTLVSKKKGKECFRDTKRFVAK